MRRIIVRVESQSYIVLSRLSPHVVATGMASVTSSSFGRVSVHLRARAGAVDGDHPVCSLDGACRNTSFSGLLFPSESAFMFLKLKLSAAEITFGQREKQPVDSCPFAIRTGQR